MVISRARKQQHRKDLIGESRNYEPSGVDYTMLSAKKKELEHGQKRLK